MKDALLKLILDNYLIKTIIIHRKNDLQANKDDLETFKNAR